LYGICIYNRIIFSLPFSMVYFFYHVKFSKDVIGQVRRSA